MKAKDIGKLGEDMAVKFLLEKLKEKRSNEAMSC